MMLKIRGTAKWAKISTPDTKFNVDGEYSVQVIVEESAAQDIISQLEAVRDTFEAEFIKDPKNKKILKQIKIRDVFEEETDEDGAPSGNVVFRTKMKAVLKSAKTGKTYEQKPAVVDAKRTPIKDPNIGNGSVINVAVEPAAYFMQSSKEIGVTLRLKAVQVLTLVQYGDASSCFDDEEGYVDSAANDNIPEAAEGEDDKTDF
jgi:hypothetical protein